MKRTQTNNKTGIAIHQEAAEVAVRREAVIACAYRAAWLILLFAFITLSAKAQNPEVPFKNGEHLKFEVKYKYGLVMMKAAYAGLKINDSNYQGNPTYKASLDIKTTSFFDGIYEVRDTMTSHISKENLQPLHNRRSVNEGSTRYTENLNFLSFGERYSKGHIIRTKGSGKIALDTIHESSNKAYDMTSLFLFIRTIDYEKLSLGDTFRISAFVGKSNTDIVVRCRGQQIVEKNRNLKYKTIKFDVDVVDDAFSESKNAMEVWISDDENRIPIKLKAKLKIGAAEAMLTSATNLKFPFTAEVNLKKKK